MFEKKNSYRKFTLFFFLFLLIAGSILSQTYGNFSDQYNSRIKGFVTLKYLGDKIAPELTKRLSAGKDILNIKEYRERIYGVGFEAPAALLEVAFGIKDQKKIYLFRNLLIFLTNFIGLIFAYKLARLVFANYKIPVLFVITLLLSPRIFSDIFYNNKDLVFSSILMIAVYYNFLFFKKKRLKYFLYLCLFSALASNIRLTGLIMLFVFPISILINSMLNKGGELKYLINLRFYFLSFPILYFLIIYIIWPFLWENPIQNFIFAFQGMSKFSIYDYSILYLGRYISPHDLPWHYIYLWIAISTPIIFIVFFLLGVKFFILETIKKKITKNTQYNIVFLFIIFFTFFSIHFFKSTMYNGWRQIYYIYPYILLIAFSGYIKVKLLLNKKIIDIGNFLIIVYLINIGHWMVKYHPNQSLYFNNFLLNKNFTIFFESDYSGITNRQVLEYLVKYNDKDNIIIFQGSKNSIYYSVLMLNKNDRERIRITKDYNEANYIINHYNHPRDNFKNKEELKIIFEVIVDGIPVNTLYEKNKTKLKSTNE